MLGKQNKSAQQSQIVHSRQGSVPTLEHTRNRTQENAATSERLPNLLTPPAHLIHVRLRPLQQSPARGHETESVLLGVRRLVQGVFAVIRRCRRCRRRGRRVGTLPSGIAHSPVINLAPVLRRGVLRVRVRVWTRRRKRVLLRVMPFPPRDGHPAPVAVRGRGGRGRGGGGCRRGRRPRMVAPRVRRSWGIRHRERESGEVVLLKNGVSLQQ